MLSYQELLSRNKVRFVSLEEEIALLREEKPHLKVIPDLALNAGASASLIDDPSGNLALPTSHCFVRSNGRIPFYDGDPNDWKIRVFDDFGNWREWTIREIKNECDWEERTLALRCAGDARVIKIPKQLAWPMAAAFSCAKFGGVDLNKVLKLSEINLEGAFCAAFIGADPSLADATQPALSRRLRIPENINDMTAMLAFEMNGERLSPFHGYPARIVDENVPASALLKYLVAVWVRRREHDGQGMVGKYREIPPGASDGPVIETMPVTSYITYPKEFTAEPGEEQEVRGVAASGNGHITLIELSTNGGRSWLAVPKEDIIRGERGAWTRFKTKIKIPEGAVSLTVRATDSSGDRQPEHPRANTLGYCHNGWHNLPKLQL